MLLYPEQECDTNLSAAPGPSVGALDWQMPGIFSVFQRRGEEKTGTARGGWLSALCSLQRDKFNLDLRQILITFGHCGPKNKV